jgi:hypothetical protein
MLFTGMPFLIATKLWASSWASTEANSRMLVDTPVTTLTHRGCSSRKLKERLAVMRAKTMNQE